MVKRRAILHIGTPKTGSTSIQSFLKDHREALATHGVHFATAPGYRNHAMLVAYAAGEAARSGTLRRAASVSADPDVFADRLERMLRDEMEGLPEGIHTVLFSSEMLATGIGDDESMTRLRDLFASLFESTRVLVYLRRQDEAAVSHYSTALHAGGETTFEVLPALGKITRAYDLARILDRYAAGFGKDAVMPRLFERGSLTGGDVVRDFLDCCGLEALGAGDTKRVRGPAMRADAQEFLRRFNALVEERGIADRPRIAHYVGHSEFHGKPRMPTRAQARAFYDQFRDINEEVRAAWFPDRPTLFAEDFSRYPETEDTSAYSDDKMLAVGLEVLLKVGTALRESEAEVQYLQGQRSEAAGALAEARRHYTNAARGENGHRRAQKALKRIDAAEAALDGNEAAAPRRRRKAAVAGAGDTAALAPRDARRAARKARSDTAAKAGSDAKAERRAAATERLSRRSGKTGASTAGAGDGAPPADRSERRALRQAARAAAQPAGPSEPAAS